MLQSYLVLRQQTELLSLEPKHDRIENLDMRKGSSVSDHSAVLAELGLKSKILSYIT